MNLADRAKVFDPDVNRPDWWYILLSPSTAFCCLTNYLKQRKSLKVVIRLLWTWVYPCFATEQPPLLLLQIQRLINVKSCHRFHHQAVCKPCRNEESWLMIETRYGKLKNLFDELKRIWQLTWAVHLCGAVESQQVCVCGWFSCDRWLRCLALFCVFPKVC